MHKLHAWPLLMVLLVMASVSVQATGQASIEGRLNAHLQRLAQEPSLAAEPVTVIVETDSLSDSEVKSQGGALRYRYGRLHEVSIPSGKLASFLDKLPDGALARLPYPHQAVAVTSQGVGVTGAGDFHALGTNGAGISIGVIDLGFASLASAQASGELPANLVATDYTGKGLEAYTNHGTQVAQVVYDMAPGAKLYLAKIETETQLSQALNDMAAAGVKVVNHSVAWFGAAFYDGTGSLCSIANSAQGKDILWVNAMGNHRLKHYLGTFTDANADLSHEFATGQNYNTISVANNDTLTLILNWNAYPDTTVDYNLYLYNANPSAGGIVIAKSENLQSASGKQHYKLPYESLTYKNTSGASQTYYIVVRKVNASQPNIALTLFSMGHDLSVKTREYSVVQPADCANVLSVGAVSLTDVPEGFSSEGPTTDGRQKPEVSAPDGVNTSFGGFWGTSASSPHAAGAAALLLARTPAQTIPQLKTAVVASVKDLSPAGFDYRTGFGRISMDADGDGLNHDEELTYGTSTINADTDGDRISDWEEVMTYHTDPTLSNRGDIAPRGAPDGIVNLADMLILSRFVAGLEMPSGMESLFADLNGDGQLDVRDLLLMRQELGN